MKLSELPNTAMTFVFVGVIIIAGFLALASLQEDSACESGYVYNVSSAVCYESANHSHTTALTYAGNASANVQEGMNNITDYASVWGTIIGVAVLLSIVIGGFAFGRSKGWI